MNQPAADSYVVRIYRRDRADPARVSGIVEVVAEGTTHRFNDFQALLDILGRQTAGSKRPPQGGSGK